MSIDRLAHQAVIEMRSNVSTLDADRALDQALDQSLAGDRGSRLTRPALVLAGALVVAVSGWLISSAAHVQSSPPIAPANQPDGSTTIGEGLRGPVTLQSPVGWTVTHDEQYVELTPEDGSAARLVVAVPDRTYDPPTYAPAPIEQDLLIWTLGHPDIQHASRYGVNQHGWTKADVALPWQGQAMDLSLRARALARGSVPLIPLPRASGDEPLTITSQDQTFRWAVIYLQGSDPIICAAISSTPRDAETIAAFGDLVQSIRAAPTR